MRATRYDRYRCAQNADHFAHNSPFSAFFAEVVCTLGMTPPRTVISPPPEGGLHDQYGGHRKTCWARLWNPWAAVPVGGGRAWPGFETTHQSASATGHHWVERPDTQAAVPVGGAEPGRASHSDTSAAGVEGPEGQAAVPVGGAGPGQASRRRAQPRTATQAPPVWRVPEVRRARAGFEIDHSEP